MPCGITQDQVDKAVDAIIATGERPTVERIRAHLGTGSPNTVTRMLDVWRQGLAERLRQASLLPDLPGEVGEAMTALWTQALQHAREHTHQEIQAEREALQQSRSALDSREAERVALLATAQANAQRAEEAARCAEVEAAALRQLVKRLEAEGSDHAREQERFQARCESFETSCAKLRDEIRAVEEKSTKERVTREEHLRSVEDRAHAQVDRARTELKDARAELADARKHHQQEVQALQQTIVNLTQSLGAAEREAAHQRGVAEALKLKPPTTDSRKRPARKAKRAGKVQTQSQRGAGLRAYHTKEREH